MTKLSADNNGGNHDDDCYDGNHDGSDGFQDECNNGLVVLLSPPHMVLGWQELLEEAQKEQKMQKKRAKVG